MDPGVDEDKRATLRRFAALGAATPLARIGDDRNGDSDARDAILGYLTATPGAHFSKVRDDLKLGTGETQHHLRRLVDVGAIESLRDGDYRRLFPAGRFSSFEQVALKPDGVEARRRPRRCRAPRPRRKLRAGRPRTPPRPARSVRRLLRRRDDGARQGRRRPDQRRSVTSSSPDAG